MVMRTFVQGSGTCKWLSAEVAQARPMGSWGVVSGGLRGFPGCPVVKTLPSNAGGVDSISGQVAKIPHSF